MKISGNVQPINYTLQIIISCIPTFSNRQNIKNAHIFKKMRNFCHKTVIKEIDNMEKSANAVQNFSKRFFCPVISGVHRAGGRHGTIRQPTAPAKPESQSPLRENIPQNNSFTERLAAMHGRSSPLRRGKTPVQSAAQAAFPACFSGCCYNAAATSFCRRSERRDSSNPLRSRLYPCPRRQYGRR